MRTLLASSSIFHIFYMLHSCSFLSLLRRLIVEVKRFYECCWFHSLASLIEHLIALTFGIVIHIEWEIFRASLEPSVLFTSWSFFRRWNFNEKLSDFIYYYMYWAAKWWKEWKYILKFNGLKFLCWVKLQTSYLYNFQTIELRSDWDEKEGTRQWREIRSSNESLTSLAVIDDGAGRRARELLGENYVSSKQTERVSAEHNEWRIWWSKSNYKNKIIITFYGSKSHL